MKPAVLCAQRAKLPTHLQPTQSAIVGFHMADIPYDAFNFINRSVADAQKQTNATWFSIAAMFPQLLPYMVIQCKDHVLLYERKGNEKRLHDLVSIGIGGHIDIADYAFAGYDEQAGVVYEPTFSDVIRYSAARELKEEIHLDVDPDSLFFNQAIIALDDEVSQVHIGLLHTIHIEEFADVRFSEEIINPKWIPIGELNRYIDNAELWSKMIIESYVKENLNV